MRPWAQGRRLSTKFGESVYLWRERGTTETNAVCLPDHQPSWDILGVDGHNEEDASRLR